MQAYSTAHLCGLSTVARGCRVYGFPQVFCGPGTSFFYIGGITTYVKKLVPGPQRGMLTV